MRYWDLRSIRAAWQDWQRHPGISSGIGVATAAVLFIIGYAVVPEQGADVWSRVATGLLALVMWGLIVLALYLLWVWTVAPVRQRDAARVRVQELEAELIERGKTEFRLTASFEDTGDQILREGNRARKFHNVKTLWVEVENQGRVAEFSARIPHTQVPVSRLEDDHKPKSRGVYNVAWEQTLSWSQTLGVGRLRVAAVSDGPIFWFWTAENATWNPRSHGWGWRMAPLEDIIEFPLIVTNNSDRKSVTRMCRIKFGQGSVESFGFADQPGD